jgi:hypothetical protein
MRHDTLKYMSHEQWLDEGTGPAAHVPGSDEAAADHARVGEPMRGADDCAAGERNEERWCSVKQGTKRPVVVMASGMGLPSEEIEAALEGQSANRVLKAVVGHLERTWLDCVNDETDPKLDLPAIREKQGRREMCAVLVADLVAMASKKPSG